MATEETIEGRYPRIIFLDGSYCIVYRGGIPTGTPEKRKLTLLPHYPSIMAAGLKKEMTTLNEPSALLAANESRVYEQWYNTEYLVPLSAHNVQWNMWLGLCNIKGEKINMAGKDFAPFFKMQQKIEGLSEQNKDQQLEISRLRKRNRNLIVMTAKRLREEFGLSPQDERIRRVLPPELVGTELGRREEGQRQ